MGSATRLQREERLANLGGEAGEVGEVLVRFGEGVAAWGGVRIQRLQAIELRGYRGFERCLQGDPFVAKARFFTM